MQINNIIDSIIAKHPELNNKYCGLGFCFYAGVLLKQELDKLNIESTLLTMSNFNTDDSVGSYIKHSLEELINIIQDNNDTQLDNIYYGIKQTYLNDGLSVSTGHCVVLVGNYVYDITSKQYCLPKMYSLDYLRRMWKDIRESEVLVDESRPFKFSKVVRSKVLY